MSLLSAVVAAVFLAWPRLETMGLAQGLIWLIAPHMFLRFIGLSFVMPGVVSPSLPWKWAAPAAYGVSDDFTEVPKSVCNDPEYVKMRFERFALTVTADNLDPVAELRKLCDR
jgi:hypothetical protein